MDSVFIVFFADWKDGQGPPQVLPNVYTMLVATLLKSKLKDMVGNSKQNSFQLWIMFNLIFSLWMSNIGI